MHPQDPRLFRLLRRIAIRIFPNYTYSGTEKLPDESCVIVGNHCQIYGPLAGELNMPRPHYIWCVGEMMDRKEVPEYAFRDFWSGKPRWTLWFWRLASHAIARPAAYLLSHAHTLPVYHDIRVRTTFRKTMECLQDGADIVIFPESAEPYNAIVTKFHDHFIDLAKLYYRKTGKSLCFVPMYIAPRLSRICFGDPVRFNPDEPLDAERERISAALADGITALARALPRHTVVPYLNIPKDQYPLNTEDGD